MDPTWPAFPILAFISFVLVLIPLPWHLEAMNTGTVLYMLWAGISSLNLFIDSILWHNNVIIHSRIWCDISSHIITGAAVGIPASSLCIMRRLYKISSIQAVTVTKQERRRAIIIDVLIAVVFPLFAIFLQYVCQGHRANIFEDYGSMPVVYNSVPAYVLVYSWPVFLGACSMYYCARILYTFATRRAQFNEFLSSHRSVNFSRYFRLMALSSLEMLVTVPLGIFIICINLRQAPLRPWVSWYHVHVHFSRIEQYPRVLWAKDYWLKFGLDCTRWLTILCGYVFFFWFGFAEEARKNYRSMFWTVAQRFGYTQKTASTYLNSSTNGGTRQQGMLTSSIGIGNATLPVFSSKRAPNKSHSKRDSFLSSMGDLSTGCVDADVAADDFDKTVKFEGSQSSSTLQTEKSGEGSTRVPHPSEAMDLIIPDTPPPAFNTFHIQRFSDSQRNSTAVDIV